MGDAAIQLTAADLPDVAGKCRGPLLIMGGARCIWDDEKRLGDWPHHRMAVNDIGQHYHGTIRHWCSLHPEYFSGWMAYRMGHNYGNRGYVHTHTARGRKGEEHCDFRWPILDIGGSSGLFAVFVALFMGYAPLVLAGMPMDGQGHYFDPPHTDQSQLAGRPEAIVWAQARDTVFEGRVKSMSGRTRDWLGAP